MDSSDLEKFRNQFNSDWRTQKTDLVDQIRHFCLCLSKLTDVVFVFRRNDLITVCCLFLNLQWIYCGVLLWMWCCLLLWCCRVMSNQWFTKNKHWVYLGLDVVSILIALWIAHLCFCNIPQYISWFIYYRA